MKFLLDTDIVSYALRGCGRVDENLLSHKPSEIGVSTISVAELRFGAHKRRSKKLDRLLGTFLSSIAEVPFDGQAADRYGRVAAELLRRGEPVGMADVMIASQALDLDLTLVTHNVRHFERIEGLRIEDWV